MTTVRGLRVALGKGRLTLFLIIVIPRSRRRYPSVRHSPSAGRSTGLRGGRSFMARARWQGSLPAANSRQTSGRVS